MNYQIGGAAMHIAYINQCEEWHINHVTALTLVYNLYIYTTDNLHVAVLSFNIAFSLSICNNYVPLA